MGVKEGVKGGVKGGVKEARGESLDIYGRYAQNCKKIESENYKKSRVESRESRVERRMGVKVPM